MVQIKSKFPTNSGSYTTATVAGGSIASLSTYFNNNNNKCMFNFHHLYRFFFLHLLNSVVQRGEYKRSAHCAWCALQRDTTLSHITQTLFIPFYIHVWELLHQQNQSRAPLIEPIRNGFIQWWVVHFLFVCETICCKIYWKKKQILKRLTKLRSITISTWNFWLEKSACIWWYHR